MTTPLNRLERYGTQKELRSGSGVRGGDSIGSDAGVLLPRKYPSLDETSFIEPAARSLP